MKSPHSVKDQQLYSKKTRKNSSRKKLKHLKHQFICNEARMQITIKELGASGERLDDPEAPAVFLLFNCSLKQRTDLGVTCVGHL
jgi:hypothetical protein